MPKTIKTLVPEKTKTKIPEAFKLTKSQCKAVINERGLLSVLPSLAQTVTPQHYPLLCVMNDVKPISFFTTNSYLYCPNRLINNIRIQIMADKMQVKTILIKKDKQDVSSFICYTNTGYVERAYLCAYFSQQLMDATPEEQQKLISFNSPYNYILGELYGYTQEEIRGYYLNKYILKSLPPKIKSKMMKYISESNFDLDFVSYKTKVQRLYNALKKVDNFADFNSKYTGIKTRATQFTEDAIKTNKYKAFRKRVKPQKFKFDLAELKSTFPDEYKKLMPEMKKFQKSLK